MVVEPQVYYASITAIKYGSQKYQVGRLNDHKCCFCNRWCGNDSFGCVNKDNMGVYWCSSCHDWRLCDGNFYIRFFYSDLSDRYMDYYVAYPSRFNFGGVDNKNE